MPVNQFPANPTDQQQYVDEFGSIWIYDNETLAWNVYGKFPQSPIVTASNDGLVTPQVYAKLQTLRDLQNKGVTFETVKLAGIKDALYYYFKSSDKMIRFTPESSNTLRIEVDKSRIYQTLYKQACPGGPGPKGYAGAAGDAGTTGATELFYEPATASSILRVSIITPTPLTATGDIPLPNNHVPDISIRLYSINDGTPDYVDQLIGFTSHFAGAYGIDSITQLINQQFECLATGGTNCPYPTDLNLIAVIAAGSVSGPLAEVLIDPTGKLPNRLGTLGITNLDISTTLASFTFNKDTNLVTGGFYSISGPWPTISPYAVKSRQKGPDGSIGIPGNCTVTVSKIELNAGSANNPLTDMRWDSVRNTIYTRSTEKNTVSCASAYSFAPTNATLVGQPDLAKLKLLAVEKTTSNCKNIGVYSFIPLAYTISDLELVSWEPQAGCTKQSAFNDSKFDWIADTNTGVCPGGLAWFSADGIRSVQYPYGIVVNTYQDGTDCCAEEFFYSPNVQDAPCTTAAPVVGTDPIGTTTTAAPTTNPPTTPMPTAGPTQAPWTPPAPPAPPAPPTQGPTQAPTTTATTTGTTAGPPTTTATTTATTTGTTKTPTTTAKPFPSWYNKNFNGAVVDLFDQCDRCSGAVAGGSQIYAMNATNLAGASAAFLGRSDIASLWTTWGTSGKNRYDTSYASAINQVWSRSQNKWVEVQTAMVNAGQKAFYYHKNWAPRNATDNGNYYINTAADNSGDLDIGGNAQILMGLATAANKPGQSRIPASPYRGAIDIGKSGANYSSNFIYSGLAYEIASIGFTVRTPTASCGGGMQLMETNAVKDYDKQPYIQMKCIDEKSVLTSFGGLLGFISGNNRPTAPTYEKITAAEKSILSAAGTQWQLSTYTKTQAFVDAGGTNKSITLYHYLGISKNAWAAGKFTPPTFGPNYQAYDTNDFIIAGFIVDVGGLATRHFYQILTFSNNGISSNPEIFGCPYIFKRAKGAADYPYMAQPASLCVPGGYNPEVCDSPYPDSASGRTNKYYNDYSTAAAGWVPAGPLLKSGTDKIAYEASVEPYLKSPVPSTKNTITYPVPNFYNVLFASNPWWYSTPSSILQGAKHLVNGKPGADMTKLNIYGAVTIPISVLVRNQLKVDTIRFNDTYSKKYWNDPFDFYG